MEAEDPKLQAMNNVHLILSRCLQLMDDVFVLTIERDGATPYVQACLEDHNEIHLELSHESFADLPVGVLERQAIEELGWEPPDSEFPNYTQVIRRHVWTDKEIIDLLVTSLDRVYHAFDGAGDLAIEVRPGALAAKAIPDEFPIYAVKFQSEDSWMQVEQSEAEERKDISLTPCWRCSERSSWWMTFHPDHEQPRAGEALPVCDPCRATISDLVLIATPISLSPTHALKMHEARLQSRNCMRCGGHAEWLVTVRNDGEIEGRLMRYCDDCRAVFIHRIGLSIPVRKTRETGALLHRLYEDGYTSSDPEAVATFVDPPLGAAWVKNARAARNSFR